MTIRMKFLKNHAGSLTSVDFVVNKDPDYGEITVKVLDSDVDLSRDSHGAVIERVALKRKARTIYLDAKTAIDTARSTRTRRETDDKDERDDSEIDPVDSDFE